MAYNGTHSSLDRCHCMLNEPSSSGFHTIDPGLWSKWTVKLKFDSSSCSEFLVPVSIFRCVRFYLFCKDDHCGTGFYLNVPDTDNYVILTAGHNLINEEKERTKNLRIEREDEQCIAIPEDNVFICQEYKESSKCKEEDDWGMILIPKFNGSPSLGFGFSLLFATEEALSSKSEMFLTIGGYPACDRFRVCSGKGQKIDDKQLEYSILTKYGMSGAPVFLAHKGVETVVGIQ